MSLLRGGIAVAAYIRRRPEGSICGEARPPRRLLGEPMGEEEHIYNALSLEEEVNVKLTQINVRGGFEVLSGTERLQAASRMLESGRSTGGSTTGMREERPMAVGDLGAG
jgi:hypothetical protein